MNKKNKMILFTCTLAALVFGGLFAANSGLLEGNSFSLSRRTETTQGVSQTLKKDYCEKLRTKVDKLEALGLDVTTNITSQERNNLSSCINLLGNFLDDLVLKCKALQKYIIKLISAGMPVSGNLSEYQKNLTRTCNINSEYGSTSYIQFLKKPYYRY